MPFSSPRRPCSRLGKGEGGGRGYGTIPAQCPGAEVTWGPPGQGHLSGRTTAGHVQSQQTHPLRSAGRGLQWAQGGDSAPGRTAAQMCRSPEVAQGVHPAHGRGRAGTAGSAGCTGQRARQPPLWGQGPCTKLGAPRGGRGGALLVPPCSTCSCRASPAQPWVDGGGSRAFPEAPTWLQG